jgi:hypothetical protein
MALLLATVLVMALVLVLAAYPRLPVAPLHLRLPTLF